MKKLFYLNKNRAGKPSNMLLGAAYLIDGLIRIVSFGFIGTSFPIEICRWQTQKIFNKIKKEKDL